MISEQQIKMLADAAREASRQAYCPYSGFTVGSALLTTDGAIFSGCNVENASYGLTICAERTAIFQMVAAGQRKIAALLLYTPTPTLGSLCGACRQVTNEFGPDALIICTCDGPDVVKEKLSVLLPMAFGPDNLDAK